MMLCRDAGFLDLFDYVPGYPEQAMTALFKSCREADGLRFVSLEWLRRLNTASGRPKDLFDLENLPPA